MKAKAKKSIKWYLQLSERKRGKKENVRTICKYLFSLKS